MSDANRPAFIRKQFYLRPYFHVYQEQFCRKKQSKLNASTNKQTRASLGKGTKEQDHG